MARFVKEIEEPVLVKLVDDPKKSEAEAGLRYVSSDEPGFTRKRTRSGFAFYDRAGKLIRDSAVLKRIRSLVHSARLERCLDLCAGERAFASDWHRCERSKAV